MRLPFQIVIPLTLLFLSLFTRAAVALTPATGIYWNPQYPGWAIYVESQKDTIFAIVYAYSSNDAEPEFFVASGPTIDDLQIDADPSTVGLFPIQGFASPLFRVPSGSCLGCVYAPIAASEQIGQLSLAFVGKNLMLAKASFPDGRRFPNPNTPNGISFERFNFSLGGVLAAPGDRSPAWPDMRGEWVFTDQTDRSRAAWRFEFTTEELGVNLGNYALRASAVYRDASRNAVMYCFITDPTGLTPAQFNALPDRGCEVRQNGQTLFSSLGEIAIDEFVGSLGPLPNRGERVYRGSQRVLGRRLSD